MNGWWVVAITTGLIVLSAFFVIIEFALIGARRQRLETEAAKSSSVRAALRGMNELTLMLAVAQLGITACTFALGAVTKPAVDAWLGPLLTGIGMPPWLADAASFALALLGVTFLHLVVGEMAPKSWALAHPERAAKLIGIPARAFLWPLRPLLTAVNRIANSLVARVGVTPVDRAAVGGRDVGTIRQLVEYSAAAGTLDTTLESQLGEVIQLQQLRAGELLRNHGEATAVSETATVAQAQEASLTSGHLRVLIRDPDGNFSRFVHVRDTLLSAPEDSVLPFARTALRVDADTTVPELLAAMRQQRAHFVLVDGVEKQRTVLTLRDVLSRVLVSEH